MIPWASKGPMNIDSSRLSCLPRRKTSGAPEVGSGWTPITSISYRGAAGNGAGAGVGAGGWAAPPIAHVATTTTTGMSRTSVALLHEHCIGPLLSVPTEFPPTRLGG